ncbi:MAG TPA: molybdopterin-synthase adenylyltransferase MoeB [bacterium]|nr:molybdopterin-synthase adenylyltransferase MoeB [bacterium]
MSNLSQDQIKRYTRHILLPEVGVTGQKKLLDAKVLVVGAGGLGCPISLYLAAAGVGTIGIVDFDTVDASNLQRQVLFTTEDVGKPKVEVAAKRLKALNPDVTVKTYQVALKSDNIMDILKDYDMIIDGTDNFPTRYLTNDAAVLQKKPNIYGSIFRFDGQVTVFKTPEGPCYRCLYPEPPPPGEVPSCAEGGVMGAMVGTVGAIQATEAIKLITGIGKPAIGKFVIYNSLDMQFRNLKLHKDPNCPICGTNPTIKELIDYEQFCGMKVEDTQTKQVEKAKDDIDALELKVMLDEKQDFTLIDVREKNEFDIARIEGAILFPMSQLPIKYKELEKYKGKEMVIMCKTGNRSKRAQQFLKSQGFDKVTNLAGGIFGWSDQVDSSIPKY